MRFIGSKVLLLNEIDKLIKKHTNGTEKVFLDLFAGTNKVGEFFKKDYKIIANDLLFFSYCNARAIISNNKKMTFSNLGFDPFEYLNNEKNIQKHDKDNYYRLSYTPLGEAGYFTEENGKKIDFIRNSIDEWYEKSLIEEDEYYYLVSCLVESIPYISNITGTYGAYLKNWDKRALKKLELKPLSVIDNGEDNLSFNQDANELIKTINADIAYLDPPYNNRQYASNYHVLENIALNNKPKLKGKTRIYDWSSKKSSYSTKNGALKSMQDLIRNITATHVIVSYNDEGIIEYEELIELLKDKAIDNKVDVVTIPYRKYMSKVSSKKKELNEYLFYIRTKEVENSKKIQLFNKKINKWIPENKEYIKSPLNYIGGKYKLLNQIIPLFPENINNFLDLFSGGANVGINVKANHYIFNDMNSKVNEVFRYFSENDTTYIIESINKRIEDYGLSKTNREAYLEFRKAYNKNPNPLDLYVLVSFSYNYQFRFNNNMEFNNPFGNNRSHFSANMKNNLIRFIEKLHSISHVFTDYLFTEIDYSFLTPDDFVYLDPPYLITTGSYNDGNRGFTNWNVKQELLMYKLMKELNKKEIPYALSNVLEHKGKSNDFLKEFISEEKLNVNYLNYNYNNSSYNSKKRGSTEVLITNYNI